jgi:hypothetical protein
MEKIDYKKVNKELYSPPKKPVLIEVPEMNFIMVDGQGNPNDKNGEYQHAVELLYALSYTIKMSIKSGKQPDGYFEYVVPPLEGFWWLANDEKPDGPINKDQFHWTMIIRQPEFVTDEVFTWACGEVKKKKPNLNLEKAYFDRFAEGLCVQIMHIGPYDDEPESIEKIEKFILENKLSNAISNVQSDGRVRRHHEIYLSDPRKTAPEKLKTVIRHPVEYTN